MYLLPDQSGNCAEGVGQIRVSAKPPRILSDKALFFLKCGHASKLNRESMGVDVVYSECSNVPISKSLNFRKNEHNDICRASIHVVLSLHLDHLELVLREVYLPLMSSRDQNMQYGISGDKLMDLLHRLVGAMQVTSGLR